MLEVTRCSVCEGHARHDLVSFTPDPYLRRLPGRTDATVRYVVCQDCGFVYQHQMMDEAEMEQLYTTSYRRPQPDPKYLEEVRVIALDVCSWITDRTGMSGTGRSVLDIGCAAGMSLRPFALQGWRAVGLDPGAEWVAYGRREYGLDLRTGFYTGASLPGETFDLILWSHVIEHVLDPAPVLAAIREQLADDGYLFIGTPNVLAPKRKLHPGLFGGDHVRLFSHRTLTTYLRKNGFRVIALETFRPRGIRALAVKADSSEVSLGEDRDDGRMIHTLFRGLVKPQEASLLEQNLAALKDQPVEVLEEVCKQRGVGLYRVRQDGAETDNVARVRPDGSETWLYGAEGSSARAARSIARLPKRTPDNLLLVGLGLGHLAEMLETRLDPSCHLHVWEPNQDLFVSVLRARDLSALLQSPRLFLHVGPELEFLRHLIRGCYRQEVGKMNDPVVAEARHPLTTEMEAWLTMVASSDKAQALTGPMSAPPEPVAAGARP